MIALDVQPFSVVEHKSFQDFVYCLNTRYELPARETIRNFKLKLMYIKCKTN